MFSEHWAPYPLDETPYEKFPQILDELGYVANGGLEGTSRWRTDAEISIMLCRWAELCAKIIVAIGKPVEIPTYNSFGSSQPIGRAMAGYQLHTESVLFSASTSSLNVWINLDDRLPYLPDPIMQLHIPRLPSSTDHFFLFKNFHLLCKAPYKSSISPDHLHEIESVVRFASTALIKGSKTELI